MNTVLKSHSQLQKLQHIVLKQQIPFVSYRLPDTEDTITLVQHHSMPAALSDLNGIAQMQGFVIAPFDASSAHACWFLQPDCVFFGEAVQDVFLDKLAANNRFADLPAKACELQSTTFDEYTGNVAHAVEAMKTGSFRKVVLSKVRTEALDADFQPELFYTRLCEKYPHAMVYLLQLPGVGCWMGATPEPLLVIENEYVHTVSLAGTQVATGIAPERYTWSEKELEEQGIVTAFIENTLKTLGVTDFQQSGPENYQAGNLIHLKTAFRFPETMLEHRFADFLGALHPTPSVGGLPKAPAHDFIHAHEHHDRSYYTGFLGPVNIEDKTNLFVNLRCLQLFESQCVLYSGAGITASSDPEKEWHETDNKMLTMLNVMRQKAT